MPSTTICKRGDIVLVPFPFTDLSAIKQRPALVVSADTWNASHADVVLVAVTSQLPVHSSAGEISLSSADLLAGGLPRASLVRTTKIFTMHQGLLRRTLGTLPGATVAVVLGELRRFFA